MTAGIRTYRNIFIKILFTWGRQPINERRQITWQSNVSDFHQLVFKFTSLRNLLKFLIKRSFINWQMHMRSIYWQAMPKVKKSDKQRQRLDKVRKRDDRATNEKAVSKTCVEKSSIPSVDVHVANNNLDRTPYMSNRGELSSRNFAAIDSPNVFSETQAIVDRYLQSQKDLADMAKKKYTDCHQVTVYSWSQPVIGVMKGL